MSNSRALAIATQIHEEMRIYYEDGEAPSYYQLVHWQDLMENVIEELEDDQ